MKKVTNITLGGRVFTVEEDAFEALSLYLKSIESKFATSPDYKEIAADIEDAMAEKFSGRKKSKGTVVTKLDVDEVIKELGTPEEVSEVEEKVGGEKKTSDDTSTTGPEDVLPKKRLYRDIDEGIISGVSAGLAKYFDIDPVIVRVIFIITAFLNGIGILAYVILWLIVPAAKTTADKYAMRGERMTVADITERVKKNLNDEENIARAKGLWGSVRSVLIELFDLLGKFLRAVLHFLRYAVGILLMILPAVGIAALVSASSVFWMPDTGLVNAEVKQVVSVVMEESIGLPFVLAVFATLFIPLVALIVLGVGMLAGRNYFTVAKSITLFVLWIVAFTISGLFAVNYGPHIINELHKVNPELFDDDFKQIEVSWHEDGGSFVVVKEDKDSPDNDEELTEGDLINDSAETEDGSLSLGSKVVVYDGIAASLSAKTLDLSGRDLSGSLKAEVGQLSDLEYIDLSDNNFTGLPAEIGQLNDLEVLVFRNNNFTGLPHELGNLSKLELLDLRGNDISSFDLEIIEERLPADTIIKIN